MTAEKYLNQIRKIDTLISNKLAERQRWYELATTTTSRLNPVKVQASSSSQKSASAMDSVIEIDSQIAELKKQRKEIIETIEQLPEAIYDVLHKKYVQYEKYQSAYDIADSRKISKRTAEKLHRKGLAMVESKINPAAVMKYAN